jgi:predicted nucleic-acid-binding protein
VIALDTNVLVRYLVQDDPVQSPKAEQILEGLRRTSLRTSAGGVAIQFFR